MGRIVITGCGWVCPRKVGNIAEVLASCASAGPAKGVGYWPVERSLLEACPEVSTECRQDEDAWLAAAALQRAIADAGLKPGSVPADRVGLVLGVGLAGQTGMIDFANDVRAQSPRFVSPLRFPQTVGNYVAGALARGFDIRGPNMTLASGMASGLDAVVEARQLLEAGQADVVYAGGCERLTPALVTGFASPTVMFSDGACLFVLEREADARTRGAGVLAVVEPPGTPRGGGLVRSVAGVEAAGAIEIERWVGRCFGALGAAAMAAGIGALRGEVVPWSDTDGDGHAVVRSIGKADSRSVTLVADADGARATVVELTTPE